MVLIHSFDVSLHSMVESTGRLLDLEQEIARQNKEIAALKAVQLEKDSLAVAYNNSQRRFKTVFEESSVGKKIINADLQIIQVNKSVVRMLGYSKEELTGRRIIEFAHPDFAGQWEILRRELWETDRTSFSLDTCIIKKDQSSLWCRVTSILFEDNGETLGYTLLEDISERKELERMREEATQQQLRLQELRHEHQMQRGILAVTVNTQEEERQRIAEGLHNSLGQLLYGAKMNLDRVSIRASDRLEESQLALEDTRKILTDCIRECRRISHEMMPTLLMDFGLKESVLDSCRQLSGKVKFDCSFVGATVKLDKHLEIVVYRTVQELMLNVVKHADASQATVKIMIASDNVWLMVKDNGKGLNEDKIDGSGIGMKTIKSNIHLLNGTFEISTEPGEGTLVNIRFPLGQ
jgi:PAS domain S-box-containing protein